MIRLEDLPRKVGLLHYAPSQQSTNAACGETITPRTRESYSLQLDDFTADHFTLQIDLATCAACTMAAVGKHPDTIAMERRAAEQQRTLESLHRLNAERQADRNADADALRAEGWDACMAVAGQFLQQVVSAAIAGRPAPEVPNNPYRKART